VILLNGPSSSGKSTLGRALQRKMDSPFLYFSSDQLVEAKVLPDLARLGAEWEWKRIRPRFFDGFHRSIAALAEAGNDLIVEHVLECEAWYLDCLRLLAPHDLFFVGVHCPLEELERRERARGNRYIGEGRSHLEEGVHTWGPYDFEIDTSLRDPEANAESVKAAFTGRRPRRYHGQ
jgi:chloramphenicol 3-O phosphotransferase